MLPIGRSAVEQIFTCDEGVMGNHNDRRTSGKMPADDRSGVILFIFLRIWSIIINLFKRLPDVKVTFASHILAAFRRVPQSCTSSTLLRHKSKIVASYAALSVTFIIKQALILRTHYFTYTLRAAVPRRSM